MPLVLPTSVFHTTYEMSYMCFWNNWIIDIILHRPRRVPSVAGRSLSLYNEKKKDNAVENVCEATDTKVLVTETLLFLLMKHLTNCILSVYQVM